MLMSSRALPFPPALLNQLLRAAPAPSPAWRRQDDQFILDLLVPGLAPADIRVQQEGHILEVGLGSRGVIRARLPSSADSQTLSATLARGVLTLTLSIQSTSLPRTIEVQEVVEPATPATDTQPV